VYRRLFSPAPLEVAELYLSRPELERPFEDALAAWKRGDERALLIFGDAGVGKRSLVQHVLMRGVAGLAPRVLHLDDEGEPEPALFSALANLASVSREPVGLAPPPLLGFEDAQRRLMSLEERQVVIIDNGDQLFRRRARDLGFVERFLQLVSATSGNVFWVVMMGKPAATLLDTTHQLRAFFTDVLEVSPLDQDALARLLLLRHRLSGFDVRFVPRPRRPLERLRHPIQAARAREVPEQDFFAALLDLSGGNPRQALLYWARVAQLDPTDAGRVVLGPLPARPADPLEGSSPRGWLVLSTFVRHGALSGGEVAEILRVERVAVQAELERFQQLGLLESVTGAPGVLRLSPLMEQPVTAALRRKNLV
jgi:hypothetical protein